MKDGWDSRPLGEIARVGAGNSAPQDKSQFEGGVHPFIRTSDVGAIRFGEIGGSRDRLNDQGITGLRRLPAGTILLPKSGASTFLNHRVLTTVDSFVASHLATVNPDPALLIDRFVLYFLGTVSAQDLIQDHAYPSLTLGDVSAIRVPVPPLSEQERIVRILDEALDGIATCNANVETNLANAQAIFGAELQMTFSKNGHWPRAALGDIAEIQSGGTPLVSDKSLWGGHIPWYSSGELNEHWTGDPERCISQAGLDRSNAKLLPEGSLLIGMYDTAALKMSILDRPAAFNQAISGVRPTTTLDNEFVRYAIQAMKPRLLLERRGVRQKNLSLGKVKSIVMPVPSRADQRATVAALLDVEEATARLQTQQRLRQRSFARLRRSILRKAFSGGLP